MKFSKIKSEESSQSANHVLSGIVFVLEENREMVKNMGMEHFERRVQKNIGLHIPF
jgi:hypothetical protein